MKRAVWFAMGWWLLILPVSLAANEDNAKKKPGSSTMLGINVVGSKEAPKVLTIVPWRTPAKDTLEPDIEPVWNPVPEVIDPEGLRRSLRLYERAGSQGREATSGNANQ